MARTVDQIIDTTIGKEGRYVNNPKDRGGPTNWGITEEVARAYGYKGDMRALPRQTAFDIYKRRYFYQPRIDLIEAISPAVAAEIFDTGVNMGPAVPIRFFQRCLNVLNREGRDYGDIGVDGQLGPMSAQAFRAYLAKRGPEGERRMLRALNALQGARYIDIAERNASQEEFMFGWLDRVEIE